MNVEEVTPHAVQEALELIRRHEDLDQSLLRHMNLVRQRVPAGGGTVNAVRLQVALADLLEELAWERLHRLRGTTDHPAAARSLSREEHERLLRADFRRDDPQLEAWSCLYYRYLAGLDLKVKDIASIARPDQAYPSRQIGRRIRKGIQALTRALQFAEEQANVETRQSRIMARLPTPSHTRLFGGDSVTATLAEALQDRQGRWIISLEGLGGLGKTAVAREMVGWAVERDLFADVGWLTAKQEEFVWRRIKPTGQPALTQDRLMDEVAAQLGHPQVLRLPPPEKRDALRQILKAAPHLIVIDNLETAVDHAGLVEGVWELANPTRFLLTSREAVLHEGICSLPLRELAEADAVAFARYHAAERGITQLARARSDSLRQIHAVTDGNPLAIKLVVGQLAERSLSCVLEDLVHARGEARAFYRFIYRYAWDSLSPAARAILLQMPHFAISGADHQAIAAASGLDERDVDRGIGELVHKSLLNAEGTLEAPLYTIHGLTHHFVLSDLVKFQERAEDE